MSLSPATNATLQAGGLAALSNVIAQCMTCYRENRPFKLDLTVLFQFVLFALVSTPPNYQWQVYLEDKFPGYHLTPKEEEKKPSREVQETKKLNVRNTAIKFALDQTIGNVFNTYAFIAAFAYFRGHDVMEACRTQFWPMRMAALKVWPLVSRNLLRCTYLLRAVQCMACRASPEMGKSFSSNVGRSPSPASR